MYEREATPWQELVSASSHLSDLGTTGSLDVSEVLRVLTECSKHFSHATQESDFMSYAVQSLIDAFILAAKCLHAQAERSTIEAILEADRERIYEALGAARARLEMAHSREEGDG